MTEILLAGVVLAVAGSFAAKAFAQDDPAVDCTAPVTQSDMNSCAYDELDAADKALNVQYKKTRAAMVEADANFDAEARGAEEALVKAQRAWITYRDNHCEAYAFQAHQGTLEPMLNAGCQAELTRARTKELQALAEGQEN